jgi:flagellar basal body-associated protein FliL
VAEDEEAEMLMQEADPAEDCRLDNFKVNLEWNEQHGRALFIISLIIIAVILILTYFMYYQYNAAQELKTQLLAVKNAAAVRKSITYLSLFAYRIIARHPDFSYIPLLRQ